MNKILVSAFLALFLSGCAAERGFITGSLSGPAAVDEAIHGEFDPTYVETNLKVWTHRGILIGTGVVLWPLAAAYGGASGIYGAYKYHKHFKNEKEWRVIFR